MAKLLRSPIAILSYILLLPIAAFLFYFLFLSNRTYANISIGQLNISGKSETEIEQILKDKASIIENQTLAFPINQQGTISIKLNSQIIKYDIPKTMEQVKVHSHSANFLAQFSQPKQTIAPLYTLDDLTLDTLLADGLRPYEKPVLETNLILNNGEPLLTISKPGLQTDRTEIEAQIKKYFDFQSNSPTFPITLQEKKPNLTIENSQEILQQARLAISRPLTLQSPSQDHTSITLEGPDLFNLLDYTYNPQLQKPTLQVSSYKVASLSAQLAPEFQKNPVEGKIEQAGGKTIVIETSQDGQALDTEKLAQLIEEHAFNPGLDRTIQIPLKTLKPAITLASVNQYGIKDLLATGTSNFQGSSDARYHNIELAAQKLSGTIIAPGQTFSMYKTIGDIEKTTGYQDSYIIKNGRTIPGIGGGVCQVSTTLFRAAFNAGLPIIERHPHTYRIDYYERDASPGLDASIYFPAWDLKFQNNTGSYILLQSKIDKANGILTFNIFGVKDGRTVNISNPIIQNQTPPPPELRITDDTLPKGTILQIDPPAQGVDVSIQRSVTKNNQTLLQDTITSHYYPWQAVYKVGTKE